jgi:hypothetical protein
MINLARSRNFLMRKCTHKNIFLSFKHNYIQFGSSQKLLALCLRHVLNFTCY